MRVLLPLIGRASNSSDSLYTEAFSAVESTILEFLSTQSDEIKAEQFADIKHANIRVIRQLSPQEAHTWESFVRAIQDDCPSLSADQLNQVAKVLASLQEANSQFALLEKLSHLPPDDLDGLNDILGTWTVKSAQHVLEIISQRLKLIAEMQRLVDDTKTDEVQQLQPLFEKSLWMLGAEFETIEYTSNKGMTKVIQNLLGVEGKGSLKRPDFVLRTEASTGFYTRPKFDEIEHEEIGIERLLILELKKPGLPIKDAEKDQPYKYYRELIEKGAISEDTKVSAFVFGTIIPKMTSGKETKHDGSYEVQPMLYETLLSRAHKRMFKLQDRLGNEPFLIESDRNQDFGT